MILKQLTDAGNVASGKHTGYFLLEKSFYSVEEFMTVDS
jgi:hypothetical protein